MVNYIVIDLLSEFRTALSAATEWGAKNVPLLRESPDRPFEDLKHSKKFISECHRGYEKSQNRVIDIISKIEGDKHLSKGEKTYWELCFRRIIDTIAYTMIKTESHLARRLILHYSPPSIDLPVINENKKHADILNAESRLSFALLADLTTFIHVCDILRVDFRQGAPRLSLIEVKSGKVNEILLEKLASYEPKEESLDLVKKDQSIEERYKSQAKRIVKQKIRLEQIAEILETDEGTDILTNQPIRLIGPSFETSDYDSFLDKLCNVAKKDGIASGTVQSCIHIGVACSLETEADIDNAKKAALFGYHESLRKKTGELTEIRAELSRYLDKKELIKGWNPFRWNLYGMSDNPFPLWKIHRDNLFMLVSGKMQIFTIFDLPGFIHLSRQLGLTMRLSSRKKAGEIARQLGWRHVPTWGARAIVADTPKGEVTVGGGIIHRFIVDLKTPSQFILNWARR
jgi:hypothetical protein